MKQPKWITEITLTANSKPGYWVTRGWEETSRDQDHLRDRHGRGQVAHHSRRTDLVPVGGIAHAGARGISKVEVQVDEGEWQTAATAAAAVGD